MVINKRAQFFLLAAVIISAIVISLGITANRATVNREPGSFYDFSYEVKREAGAVLDYEIYTNIQIDGVDQPLEDFVELLAKDIRDKNPNANFKFLYGNNETLTERDFGDTGSGAIIPSSITIGGFDQEVSHPAGTYDENSGTTVYDSEDIGEGETFSLEVEGNEFSFPISRHRQVVFIMQKDVEDESFVTVA